MKKAKVVQTSVRLARRIWKSLTREACVTLAGIVEEHSLSVARGDLLYLNSHWYVTHTGLLGVARRHRCAGIHVRPATSFCDPSEQRWAFEATVYKSTTCKGFVGFGDADPSNVSFLVHGAEMRVAETRAVNRALRKAYGIGICSVEEVGALASQPASHAETRKLAQPANGNGNHGGPKVRDRLCQIIRQHQLDPNLVKAYATEFCGVKALRDAARDQVENFVTHLADWAEKDRNALLCQLNSYPAQKAEGAA
jgi:hypothetical protein